MQYSAKRGIAIACRLSVCLSACPSVTLVDREHIGWKYWKLINYYCTAISPTPSLFVAQRPSTPVENGEILRRLEEGFGKVVCCSTKAATGNISETRKDRGQESRAIARSTARCRCKFRCVSYFTLR